MPLIEESEAFRHWRDLVRYSRGEDAVRSGMDYLLAQVTEGWVFRPGEVDAAADMADFADFGLAAPLRRFWPRLNELVAGNEALAHRMARLGERLLTIELDLDGFAAATRRFPDDSYLVQIDTGLLSTIFQVVQLFVTVSMPDLQLPVGQAEREASVVLELLLAEYRVLRRNASAKTLRPTPAQGEALGELTQAANVFVLAHEVSHLLIGHAGVRQDEQRQREEIESDVLAFRIIAGAYAADPAIDQAQARGRLLGARLLFSCIELFERATFVTLGRTHPPAADRWEVVRITAEQIYGAPIPDSVDHVWRPMDRLLHLATSGELPLTGVKATLESMMARQRYIGGAVDVPSALGLIRLFRLTNATDHDPAVVAGGAALAADAKLEAAGRSAITWSGLLDLQARRCGELADEYVPAVAVAARILRESELRSRAS